jgi:hypothetical protein
MNGRLAWPVAEIRRLMGVAALPTDTKKQWAFAKTPVVQAKTPGAA